MDQVSGQPLPPVSALRWMPRCIVAILALSLSLIPLVAQRLPVADAAAWPYTALQTELDTTYSAMEAAVAPLPVLNATPRYIVPLLYADGNAGASLIGTNGNAINASVARATLFLQVMKAQGFNATTITVPWPLLDPAANYPGLQYYQQFYTQVIANAKALGFWTSMASGVSPSGTVNYSQYTSIDQVFAGRRAQAWWIAKTLQPDVVVVGAEPGTDKQILHGIPDISRFDASYWGQHFALLMAGKPSGTASLYAGGASPHDTQALYDAAVTSPLDVIDQHPFPMVSNKLPTGHQFWQNMLARFAQSRAAHKPLIITQLSPYKQAANEMLSANVIYARDVWAPFEPQDQHFERMWQQLATKEGLIGVTYWWANRTFLGGYIPYDSTLSARQATSKVDHAATVNLTSAQPTLTTEGQLWAAFGRGIVPGTPTPTRTTPTPTGTSPSSTPMRSATARSTPTVCEGQC